MNVRSKYVRVVEKVIEDSGLEHQLTPMATCVQGDLDSIFELVKQCHAALAAEGCARISTHIKLDDRRDKDRTMQDKVDAVQKPDA